MIILKLTILPGWTESGDALTAVKYEFSRTGFGLSFFDADAFATIVTLASTLLSCSFTDSTDSERAFTGNDFISFSTLILSSDEHLHDESMFGFDSKT
jgi:hypothetical protein